MKRALNQGISNQDDLGAVIAELAIVLPFLAILLVTIIDLGLLVREHQILQNAAREGARFSMLQENCLVCSPADCKDCPSGGCNSNCRSQAQITADLKQRVIDYLGLNGITIAASDITIDQAYLITISSGPPATTVTGSLVTVTYNRNLLIPGAPVLPFTGATLTGRAVFRNLY